MSTEIKSWSLFFFQLVSTAILCPRMPDFFARAGYFTDLIFVVNIGLWFTPCYKETVKAFMNNKGMMAAGYYKSYRIFYYFIIGLFVISQIGYYLKAYL